MPELPEVETIRRTLLEKIQNQTIKEIICYHPDVLINQENLSLNDWLIQDIRRRGKYLLFDLTKAEQSTTENNSIVAMIHLRMTGKLLLEDTIVEPAKHTHVRFILNNGGSLDFNDVRRFGRVTLFSAGNEFSDRGYATLGPEPLGDDFTADYLIKICQRFKRSTIKGVLLNQQAIAGIGNIYADESLFRAGIKPDQKAGEISEELLTVLHQKIREVIAEAIGHRGTSFRDYVDGLGNKGFFQLKLAVYQKDGDLCPVCDTTIEKIKVAGRSTHFCPNCQK